MNASPNVSLSISLTISLGNLAWGFTPAGFPHRLLVLVTVTGAESRRSGAIVELFYW
jgi:hypothetical protein